MNNQSWNWTRQDSVLYLAKPSYQALWPLARVKRLLVGSSVFVDALLGLWLPVPASSLFLFRVLVRLPTSFLVLGLTGSVTLTIRSEESPNAHRKGVVVSCFLSHLNFVITSFLNEHGKTPQCLF